MKEIISKITYAISFVIASLLSIVYSTVAMPIGLLVITLVAVYRAKRGTASIYHHVKYGDGSGVSFLNFMRKFSLKRHAIHMNSDEGDLAIVHGCNGKFVVENALVDHDHMSTYFENGNYILISCGNGKHYDFRTDNQTFVRDQNTITHYMSLILPLGSSLITFADRSVDIYAAALNILTLRYIPKLLKSNKSLEELMLNK